VANTTQHVYTNRYKIIGYRKVVFLYVYILCCKFYDTVYFIKISFLKMCLRVYEIAPTTTHSSLL